MFFFTTLVFVRLVLAKNSVVADLNCMCWCCVGVLSELVYGVFGSGCVLFGIWG